MVTEGFKFYLTRAQVAKRLEISIPTVRRWEGRYLHPKLKDGVHLFDPLDVEGVAARRAGKKKETRAAGTIAAAVFAALERGLDMRQIVTSLAVPPNTVIELYRDWNENDVSGLRRSLR